MDLEALPRVAKPFPVLALLFHTLHGAVVASLVFALSLSVYYFSEVTDDPFRARWYLFALLGVIALELGLAAWLILRRMRIRKLVQTGRREIRMGRAGPAREAFLHLLRFVEYRLRPAATLYGLAIADLIEGERERAMALLKRAGAYPSALEVRAKLMIEDGLPIRALHLLALVVAIAPRRHSARLLYEEALRQNGQHELADKISGHASRKPADKEPDSLDGQPDSADSQKESGPS